jgi:hypothetical protein
MNKKLTTMFATMLIALSLAGVSYAMWSKTLYIDGTVKTGEVDAEFVNFWSSDRPNAEHPEYAIDSLWSKDGMDSTTLYENVPRSAGKDVGWTTVTVSDDKQTITVEVNNAYPDYQVGVHFEIKNTGTIPVKVKITWDFSGIPDEICGGAVLFDISDGTQIDPGETHVALLGIWFEQGEYEGMSGTFTYTIRAIQWNEYS